MNRFIKILSLISLLLYYGCTADLPVRQKLDFNDDWKFMLGDIPEASDPDYDDSGWRTLELPHDWAVEGDFSRHNPSGVGGGALPGGVGWYRKAFVPAAADSTKAWRLEFDGVYMNSEVFLNGVSLGIRPYGYISFGYDIGPLLKWDEENMIAVRVDNDQQPNSRWYSGCGIYRNVWMVRTSKIHVASNGTYVTSSMDREMADLKVHTKIINSSASAKSIGIMTTVQNANGKQIALTDSMLELRAKGPSYIIQKLTITNPELWDVENPYLYTVVTQLYDENGVIDRYETRTGIRTFEFTSDKGFILNGRPMKINGVCMHHDLGCLGAAVNKHAIRRQLDILKSMGCNAIRTSHNPPAPELLDLCDEMGFIVQDEAFDMWRKRKTAYDYSRYFDEWHERDLRDFIIRDRNHPSIFMWSIGNEVLEQWSDASADTLLTAKLAGIVHRLDSSRPVTAGCNEPNPWNHLFMSGALDIIGYNYHNQNIPDVPKNFPGKPFIITESNSALMTRGYYRMPSDRMFIWPERWDIPFHDKSFSCSSYENCHVPWGNTHEETLKLIRDNDFISGQFVWTGFDYIGEPTPYGWPARSSYFGIVDLAGFPKDVYYLYQSEWTDEPVLHLFPHWNWKDGQEIDMWCYYNNADEVELFVNGVSQGVRSKTDDCLHAVWRVVYRPGHVEVVARRDGAEVARKSVRTAGKPTQVRLRMHQYGEEAADDALAFVTVEVLDAEGNFCPTADNLIHFELNSDKAFIAGVDNGNQISMERFKDTKRKAFNGKCLVVLQAEEAGSVILKATSKGLATSEIKFKTK